VSRTQLPTTPNISTRLRTVTAQTISRMGTALHRLGVHPDAITLVGTAFSAVAAFVAAQGQFQFAALILIIGLPLDVLDGAVARAMGRTNPFGGVFDSTMDRYADLFMLLAIAYYYAVLDDWTAVLLAFAAVVGSSLVSYIRARAGNAGLPCAGGFFSRFERSVVLLIALITGWMLPGLVVLAVGSNLTAVQRLWSVYRFAQAGSDEESV
jgi:CDP-diacylglycerol--glycerol-3-phosphate 3-phosphatidyltransferase